MIGSKMGSQNFTLRRATYEDADALNEIEILSRPTDSSWRYRYPHRDEFPEDHRRFNRMKWDGILSTDSAVDVILVEAPSLEDSSKTVPIALSVWDMPKLPQQEPVDKAAASNPSVQASPRRRDDSPAHVKAFIDAHGRAKKFFLEDGFASEGSVYCMVLATHPLHQGRGAATALCRWGMNQAQGYGLPMCITSSQEDGSRRLYDTKLGFKSLGAYVVRIGNELEHMRGEVLGWDPRW